MSRLDPTRPGPTRLDPARVGPAHVPAWVQALPSRVDGSLPVGAPGKVGLLEVGFGVGGGRDDDGRGVGSTAFRTVVTNRFQKSPLQMVRPHYLDRATPGVPVVQVASTGGGVVAGDRLGIDVRVGAGAHAVVTTQSATRVHRADAGYAGQRVRLVVGAGAVCEWVPEPVIPYAGSRFVQELDAEVGEGAVLVVAEVVTAGRQGRDDDWSAEAYCSTTEIRTSASGLVAVDRVALGVGAPAATDPLVAAGARAVGSLFVVTGPGRDGVDLASLRTAARAVADGDELRAGVSTLAGGAGYWARVVGREPHRVHAAVHALWSAARLGYAGVPAPALRLGA